MAKSPKKIRIAPPCTRGDVYISPVTPNNIFQGDIIDKNIKITYTASTINASNQAVRSLRDIAVPRNTLRILFDIPEPASNPTEMTKSIINPHGAALIDEIAQRTDQRKPSALTKEFIEVSIPVASATIPATHEKNHTSSNSSTYITTG